MVIKKDEVWEERMSLKHVWSLVWDSFTMEFSLLFPQNKTKQKNKKQKQK